MEVTKKRICRDLRSVSPEDFQQMSASANSGNVIAQFNLAICYMYGQCTDVDFTAAYNWFTNAERQGDQQSGLFLGYMNELGLGRKNNYAKAIDYYMKYSPSVASVDNGSMKAQADRLDNYGIIQHLNDCVDKAKSLKDQIVKIKHFCVFYPKDGSYHFKWTDETRAELKEPLEKFNNTVEEIRAYYAVSPKVCEQSSSFFTYIILFDIFNALYGRDVICKYINKVELPSMEMEKYFEYVLGQFVISDSKFENGRLLYGMRLIIGHDQDLLWQQRVDFWNVFQTPNLESQFSEENISLLLFFI